MAFIDSFGKLISSFISKKESSRVAVGIDIGATSVKLVQFSLKNNRIVLDTYGSIALGPYANLPVGAIAVPDAAKIGEAIKELVKECNADVTRTAVALPTSASLFRDIGIPSGITDSEMKTVALTEARKVIPVPVADVDIDWLSIPKEILPEEVQKEDKKHLLLVAVSHESKKRVESYMSASGILPVMYEIEVFSSMRSIYTHERAPIVLIDLGAAHIKVSIIHEGSMRRALSLDRGFNELDNALVLKGMDFAAAHKIKHTSSITALGENETAMRETYVSILKDIANCISEYERYSHASPVRAVLLGGGAEMADIVPFTESILGITTEKSHPFVRATVPELVKDIIPTIEPEFTVCAGIAMRLLAS